MKYQLVTTKKDIRRMCRFLDKIASYADPYARAFSYDTETHVPGGKLKFKQEALVLDRGRIMFASFAHDNMAWGLPFSGFDSKYMRIEQVFKYLEPYFKSSKVQKVMHNANYDVNMTLNHGIKMNYKWPSIYCTMLAGHCWDETLPNSLKERCVLLDMVMRQTKSVDFENLDELAEYATKDAIATWRLRAAYEQGRKVVLKDGRTRDMKIVKTRREFFEKLEMPLLYTIIKMERKGIYLSRKQIERIDKEIMERMDRLAGKIYQKNGEPFNISSTKQLSVFLYNKLELDPPVRTKSGAPSCNKVALARLQGTHSIIPKIVEYNSVKSLRRFTSPKTSLANFCDDFGRIHGTIKQVGARTSRMSMALPNLQQIPSKTDVFKMRNAFRARKGNKLIVADMDQLELRLIANFSKDPMMLRAYKTGVSIHVQTGILCGLLPKDFTKEKAKADLKLARGYMISKNCNFGLQYEGTFYTLMMQLLLEGIVASETECKEIVRKYWEVYRQVPLYRQYLYEQCRKYGYIRNICRRPIFINEINNPSQALRRRAERQAINSQIQSSGADWMKYAMLRCEQSEELAELGFVMLLQIHDELIFEGPEANAEAAKKVIVSLMEMEPPNLTIKLSVPLTAGAGIGQSWSEAKD